MGTKALPGCGAMDRGGIGALLGRAAATLSRMPSGANVIKFHAIGITVALFAAGEPAAAAGMTCSDLVGLTVPAVKIGLPTRGAIVTDAKTFPGSQAVTEPHSEYCQASISIAPIDPNAPMIRMQLNLPAVWNDKAMMFTGGGYDGVIPDGTRPVLNALPDQPGPLALGYATFGSDSGHDYKEDPANPAIFALNDEARINFASAALKKTRDTAIYLIRKYYGATPKWSYVYGGSSGGREALAFAQKWPSDFNGIVALYPATAAATLDLEFGHITRTLARPGAFLNVAKRTLLFDAVMQACDKLDGAADGIISNHAACNARFDPAAATIDSRPLRCPDGADTGDTCLSDLQIDSMRVINAPLILPYKLASGETGYPGFNAWGTDFGRIFPPSSPGAEHQENLVGIGFGTVPPRDPMVLDGKPLKGAPAMSPFWDQWVKFFITGDPNFPSTTLDPVNPGHYQARIRQRAGEQDMSETDLSAFRAHGGKLLILQGTIDQLVSSRATAKYVDRVTATMGAKKVASFMRYYEVPGFAHSFGSTFYAAWDGVSAIEQWVEKGVAPTNLIAIDINKGSNNRTRPLCEYPKWPKYAGMGDMNRASSFICVAEGS